LISFSFDKLQDVFKGYHTPIPDHLGYTLLTFMPCLLADLKQLVRYYFHSRIKFSLHIFYDTAIICQIRPHMPDFSSSL